MVNLKLDSQQKISGLGELLMVAAKAPSVSDEGMKMALQLLDDLKAAVADAHKPVPVETKEGHA